MPTMGVVPYALMTYGLMAVIALAVVAIIVLINKLLSKSDSQEEDEEHE